MTPGVFQVNIHLWKVIPLLFITGTINWHHNLNKIVVAFRVYIDAVSQLVILLKSDSTISMPQRKFKVKITSSTAS